METQVKKRLEEAKALKLQDEVSKDFELVGLAGAGKVVTNKLTGQLTTVDLSKISKKDAQTLVEKGFKNLKPRNKAAMADIQKDSSDNSNDKGKSGKA